MPLEYLPTPRRPREATTMTRILISALTIITVDLIDVITATAGPIIATTTGIDVIIAATTAAMTDATTIVTTTATTGVTTTKVIAVMTSAVTAKMTDVMTDVAKTTTTATTTTVRSGLHRHHLKGATPMVRSSQPTERSTSSSAVAKQAKAADSSDQTQGRSGMSTLKLRTQRWSEFPITFSRKDHWVHIPDLGTYPLVVNPIVDGAFLPKTLIDGAAA
jgi:hypothetical protein